MAANCSEENGRRRTWGGRVPAIYVCVRAEDEGDVAAAARVDDPNKHIIILCTHATGTRIFIAARATRRTLYASCRTTQYTYITRFGRKTLFQCHRTCTDFPFAVGVCA